MASDSSTSGIEGIVSGYSTSELIKTTLKSQQNLIDNLDTKSLKLDVELQAYLAVNTYLKTFTDSVESLADSSLWNTLAATSSNENSLTATIDDTAAAGTYTFEVLQLAQASQSTSTGVSSKTSSLSPSSNGYLTIESSKAQLSRGTELATLNGGKGISHGIISITDSTGATAKVDLRGALTMKDVINAINDSGLGVTASISDDGNRLVVADDAGGTLKISDSTGTAAADLGIKGSFSASVTGSSVYGLSTSTTLAQLHDGLGVNDGTPGTITLSDGTSNWNIDLSGCTTLGQVITAINTGNDNSVTASISADGRSLTLTSLVSGAALSVTSASGDTTAADLGFSAAGTDTLTGGKLLADMNSVQISSLSGNNGTGLNGTAGQYGQSLGSIALTVNGTGYTLDLDAEGVKSDDSLTDLLSALNKQADDQGLNLTFQINSTGNGIAVVNGTGYAVEFNNGTGTIAEDLGLNNQIAAVGATIDGGDLDLKYVSRASSLDALNSGAGVDKGSFTLTDAEGYSAAIDLSSCKTMGDVIDAINAAGLAVTARINDTGDGLLIEATSGTGTMAVQEVNGGTAAADLGLTRADGTGGQLNGSYEINISVSTTDSLTDVMNKINNQTSLNAYIMSDGSSYSPYRLVIASDATGAASDFMVSSAIDGFSFSQTAKGQDSLLLYGSESSGSEPLLSASSTNTNNSTVIGMTLNLTAVSGGKVSMTLSRDNQAIVDALQSLVDSYNELKSLVDDMQTYLEDDAATDDEETTDYTGLLYGDNNTRVLMDTVTSLFTNSVTRNSLYTNFSDLGISFDLNEDTDDMGNSAYTTELTLDTDTIEELLSSDFDNVMKFFVNSSNAALATQGATVSSNCAAVDSDHSLSKIIDGDTSGGSYFQAADTIANGDNTVTVTFKEPVLMDYLTVYFTSTEDSLSDYTVEYLDDNTGEWTTLRELSDNSSAYNVISTIDPVSVRAVRVTASGTNSSDGVMRLAEISVKSESGVGAFMMQSLNSLLDSEYGYAITEQNKVDAQKDDIENEISRLQDLYDKREATLWAKYNAMETTLALLQSKSDYFQSVMSSISGTSSSSKSS